MSGDQEIHLSFWQWYAYSTGYDSGRVQISVFDDGAGTWSAWSTIGSVTGYSSVWAQAGADLTGYAGKKIKIGFSHTSNYGYEAGWFIDDVEISCIADQKDPEPPIYLDVTSCADTNSNNCPDVVSLHINDGKSSKNDGKSFVTIKDGCNGKFIRSMQFFDNKWRAIAVACLADIPDQNNTNMNGISELAVLAVNRKSGNVVVKIRDAKTRKFLKAITFFDKDWNAKSITEVPDMNANGAPEIAVMAVKKGVKGERKVVVRVKDALTRELLKVIAFPGS